ncbi:MAG: monooxygenase [Micromonosporaceae bacterium]
MWRMARDRRRLRRTPGVRFGKLLGTAPGFGPRQTDPTRWAMLAGWAHPDAGSATERCAVARSWHRFATGYCRLDLRTLTSRGQWARRQPFTATGSPPDGPVLALTRARLRPGRAAAFWRAIGPVGAAVWQAPGLLAAFGIGEAPLGWQGTVSVWRGLEDLHAFAHRDPRHVAVMTRTPTERWFAEELFARFAVLDTAGDLAVIGWTDGRPR